jgi:hypothetical protein
MNPNIPIMLGAGNESIVRLGRRVVRWSSATWIRPGSLPHYSRWLEEGFRRVGSDKSLDKFEIWPRKLQHGSTDGLVNPFDDSHALRGHLGASAIERRRYAD